MTSNARPVRLTLQIDEAHLERLSEVVARLKVAGLRIENVSETIGSVSGSIDEGLVAALSSIRGVAAVERARDYRSPSSESELQ